MFGRHGGSGDQPARSLLHLARGGIRLQVVYEEVGRTFHHIVVIGQELLVARVEIMLPDVGGKPSPARWEHAPGSAIDRAGNAPEVGVVMGHPSPAAIHVSCGLGPRLAQIANHAEQRLLRLGQVSDERRPVVHLGVDVDGVLRVPRGVHLVVPHALQISGLATGLRGGDEQIASVLHHQRHQVQVSRILLESLHALVGLKRRIPVLRQHQLHAAVLFLILLDMVLQLFLVVLALQRGQRLAVLVSGITRDVVIVHEVGGSGHINGNVVGHANPDGIALLFDQAHLALYLHTTFSAKAGFDALMILAVDDGYQLAVGHHPFRLQRAVERQGEGDGGRPVSRDTYDDDVVSLRGENSALETGAIIRIMCSDGGIVQIQHPLIVCHLLMAEIQLQAAHGQIAHAVGPFHEILVDDLRSLTFLALEDELTHLLQVCLGLRAVVVVGRAAPEGFFVQLNFLNVGAAIDHGSQMTVAYGKCLQPVGGGTAIPQPMLLCGDGCCKA